MPVQEASIVQAQLESLDDTDCYASVWNDILSSQRDTHKSLWGGRGKGGRGLSRKTVQPYDIIVEDVRLQYLRGDLCLDRAKLKLLHGRTYALCGKNGCGKSTLLQRMHAQKIPGWSTQWSSLYIPPELPSDYLCLAPSQVVKKYRNQLSKYTRSAVQARIDILHAFLDDVHAEEDQDRMEQLCEELAKLEESLEEEQENWDNMTETTLHELCVDAAIKTCKELSPGQRKRVLIGTAILLRDNTNLLLLDEPSAHLDVFGLIQLRRLLETYSGTTVLISHDVDFLNDVATDIIEMQDQQLWYFPGNYDSYRIMKEQQGMHQLKKSVALEKKRGHLLKTLQNLKEKPAPKRGGAKKKAKAISSQRKKLERHQQLELTVSAAPQGDALIPVRRGLTAQQRLRLAETLARVPDKAIQFNFPQTTSTWGEPLITAMEIGFGYSVAVSSPRSNKGITTPSDPVQEVTPKAFRICKKEGYLFDCVDFCLGERARHCICGPSASGKSTLVRILSKRLKPLEGEIHHASGVQVGYFDASSMQERIDQITQGDDCLTALAFLSSVRPEKSENEIRGHFSAFGLSPTVQTKTPISFLSSGEKCRVLLAVEMIDSPPVLFLDDPTLHLDVHSVQALVHGLRNWNGALMVVSSDANFLRCLDNLKCSVLVSEEGKLRKLEGGMDFYLKTFQDLKT